MDSTANVEYFLSCKNLNSASDSIGASNTGAAMSPSMSVMSAMSAPISAPMSFLVPPPIEMGPPPPALLKLTRGPSSSLHAVVSDKRTTSTIKLILFI